MMLKIKLPKSINSFSCLPELWLCCHASLSLLFNAIVIIPFAQPPYDQVGQKTIQLATAIFLLLHTENRCHSFCLSKKAQLNLKFYILCRNLHFNVKKCLFHLCFYFSRLEMVQLISLEENLGRECQKTKHKSH